jgi:hypothetical protein
MCDHLGITQDRRTRYERAPSAYHKIMRDADITRDIHHAAGMNHSNDDASLFFGKSAQVRFAPDNRERFTINRRAISQVITMSTHDRLSCARN